MLDRVPPSLSGEAGVGEETPHDLGAYRTGFHFVHCTLATRKSSALWDPHLFRKRPSLVFAEVSCVASRFPGRFFALVSKQRFVHDRTQS